jgi:hypothetical protein
MFLINTKNICTQLRTPQHILSALEEYARTNKYTYSITESSDGASITFHDQEGRFIRSKTIRERNSTTYDLTGLWVLPDFRIP